MSGLHLVAVSKHKIQGSQTSWRGCEFFGFGPLSVELQKSASSCGFCRFSPSVFALVFVGL